MRTVEANGTTIAYTQSGGGAPIVLIHGAEADHSMFDAFGALLAEHFTVIAYDQRDSGATRNPPTPYGIGEMADDAAALIAGLGYHRAHVFGTSLGGVIAQVLAARHPRRVDRLLLSSTFRAGTPPMSINPDVFPRLAALRSGLPGTAAEIATYFFPASHIAARREPRATRRERPCRDHGIDARAGRRRRPAHPAGAYAVAGAGDRRCADREHPRPRPCRDPAGPAGRRARGAGVPARRRHQRINDNAGRRPP